MMHHETKLFRVARTRHSVRKDTSPMYIERKHTMKASLGLLQYFPPTDFF
jgi:hypothetical protein